MPDPMVEALLREREGYVRRGLAGRVAQCDAELKARGHKQAAQQRSEAAADAPEAVNEPPRRRGRPPKSTTEEI